MPAWFGELVLEIDMRRLSAACLLATLALLSVQPARGQESEGTSITFELTAFAGGALPLSDLADFIVPPGGERIENPKMENGVALGAHAGLRFGQLSLEGTFGFIPSSYSGNTTGGQVSIDTDILLFGGSLLYTLPSSNQLMEIFLAGGAGGKTHSPSEGDSQTNVFGSLGAGLRVFVSPSVALRFEARDYISPFTDGNLQNDLLITVGLSISFPGS
jgi:hypothetical protein